MAKPIYSMEPLTEQIERPVYTKPSIAHTQAPKQPVTTVTLCASCANQMNEDYSICDNGIIEGGTVGMRFCVWNCRNYTAKNQ